MKYNNRNNEILNNVENTMAVSKWRENGGNVLKAYLIMAKSVSQSMIIMKRKKISYQTNGESNEIFSILISAASQLLANVNI